MAKINLYLNSQTQSKYNVLNTRSFVENNWLIYKLKFKILDNKS